MNEEAFCSASTSALLFRIFSSLYDKINLSVSAEKVNYKDHLYITGIDGDLRKLASEPIGKRFIQAHALLFEADPVINICLYSHCCFVKEKILLGYDSLIESHVPTV